MTKDVHGKQYLQYGKIAFSKTLFYMAPIHTARRNKCSFLMNISTLSIAMKTVGVLVLFPLLNTRYDEAKLRSFKLLENTPPAEFHGSPLVPFSSPYFLVLFL